MADEKLTRREFLQAGSGFIASALLTAQRSAPKRGRAAARPNIVYILSDQLRSVSLGAYGNPDISTPNIDQLATEGALFDNAVTTSPICGPHRACLMTGRYPNKTGVVDNEIKLQRNELCIAEFTKIFGYESLYIGKWHLDGPTPGDVKEDPGWVHPKDRQGFQNWSAFNAGHLYYGSHYYENFNPNIQTVPNGIYEPDFQTDRAIDFISQQRDVPFFVFLSYGPPHQASGGLELPPGGHYHFPYNPESISLRPNVDYEDEEEICRMIADYYGMISNIDWNVGRIVAALENHGLMDNTILVFSADHGDLLGSHSGIYGRPRGKSAIEKESLNVPFIIRFPRLVAPQTVSNIFTSVDILPTILGLSQIHIHEGVMGSDYSPLLVSGNPPSPPPYGTPPSSDSALVGIFNGNWVGLKTPEYTYEVKLSTLTPIKLYDDINDPYQLNNLVHDPGYADVVKALYKEMLEWMNYIV
jgi:arylsulfatase A-like enzyme